MIGTCSAIYPGGAARGSRLFIETQPVNNDHIMNNGVCFDIPGSLNTLFLPLYLAERFKSLIETALCKEEIVFFVKCWLEYVVVQKIWHCLCKIF